MIRKIVSLDSSFTPSGDLPLNGNYIASSAHFGNQTITSTVNSTDGSMVLRFYDGNNLTWSTADLCEQGNYIGSVWGLLLDENYVFGAVMGPNFSNQSTIYKLNKSTGDIIQFSDPMYTGCLNLQFFIRSTHNDDFLFYLSNMKGGGDETILHRISKFNKTNLERVTFIDIPYLEPIYDDPTDTIFVGGSGDYDPMASALYLGDIGISMVITYIVRKTDDTNYYVYELVTVASDLSAIISRNEIGRSSTDFPEQSAWGTEKYQPIYSNDKYLYFSPYIAVP